MSAKGRAFLLYLDDTDAATAVPTAVGTIASSANLIAGCQERSFTINNEGIDGTTAPAALSTPLWATMFAGAKNVTIEAAARFVSDAAETAVFAAALAEDAYMNAAMVYPPFTDDGPTPSSGDKGKTLVGKFLITSLTASGSLSDTFNWNISLTSTGPVALV